MKTTIEKNKKFLDFVYTFNETVKKENWISRYDIESDSLSFTIPKLSEDARIRYFDDEIGFYFTKDNNIEGIFIEYFKSNFIKHHKGFKKLLNAVEKDDETVIELNKNKVIKVIPKLENIIQTSVAENIKFEPTIN